MLLLGQPDQISLGKHPAICSWPDDTARTLGKNVNAMNRVRMKTVALCDVSPTAWPPGLMQWSAESARLTCPPCHCRTEALIELAAFMFTCRDQVDGVKHHTLVMGQHC